MGTRNPAPVLDLVFGLIKANNKYYTHGPTGIHILNSDLSFNRQISRLDSGLPADRLDSLVISNGKLFAGTVHGLAMSSDDGETWVRLPINDSTGFGTYFQSLAATSDKVFGLSTEQKLYVINLDGSVAAVMVPGTGTLPSGTIRRLTSIGNVLYVSTNAGVHFTSDGGASWSSYVTPQLLSNSVNEVSGSAGSITVSTDLGISVFNGSTWSSIKPADLPGGFATNAITKTRVDGARMIVATPTYPVFGQPRLGVSQDSGATWTHLDNYPANCPIPSGLAGLVLEGTKIVFGSATGVTYSLDFGATWNCVGNGGNRGASINSYLIRDGNTLYSPSWGHGFWKGSLATDQWSESPGTVICR
jgi:hypothetical protein